MLKHCRLAFSFTRWRSTREKGVAVSYSDGELLPISALQHLAFCERQCALIHVEREWEENKSTVEGNLLHERVDEGYQAFRRGLKQYSGVHVQSIDWGIRGRLDLLELTAAESGPDNFAFLGLKGAWRVTPVEFKRGKPKSHDADLVQLCAQALCLEEMTGTLVEQGSLFYGLTRRRLEVPLDEPLRQRTVFLIRRLREIIESKELPPPVLKRHCSRCSLENICQPRITNGQRITQYREELLG